MNILQRLKMSLIRRSLDKRRISSPFVVEAAEHFSLPLDADETQNNSYYFSCHDMQGNSLLMRYAKRGQNQTEVWFAYKDAASNAYVNERQLYIGEDAPAGVRCRETGEVWDFFYDGELKNLSSGKRCAAHFRGTFCATGGIFEFGHDVDSSVLAAAIAKEKWSRAFFADLQQNDQVHYEQQGRVEGVLEIDGARISCALPAMRDHSYGKRDWRYMNRHFWLMALLEDGGSLNANMVSYPALRALQTGYFVSKQGVSCITEAKILEDIAPGAVPDAFSYKAKRADGKEFTVVCKKERQFDFPFDGYTLYEGIGTFDVDGIAGRGILEFGWNSDAARYA